MLGAHEIDSQWLAILVFDRFFGRRGSRRWGCVRIAVKWQHSAEWEKIHAGMANARGGKRMNRGWVAERIFLVIVISGNGF